MYSNRLDGVTELIIDMKGLDYLSSAGLRVLLGAQKTMNKQGSMKVTHGLSVCRTGVPHINLLYPYGPAQTPTEAHTCL